MSLVICSHYQPCVHFVFALGFETLLLVREYDGVLLSVCDWTLFGLLPVVCNLNFMLEGQSLKASCCPLPHFLWI